MKINSLFALGILLTACGRPAAESGTDGIFSDWWSSWFSRNEMVEGEPAYELAQGCYALKNGDGHWLNVKDAGGYLFQESGEPEKYFLKPTRLGSFLLYDREGSFVRTKGFKVIRRDSPLPEAEWSIFKIKGSSEPRYTLVARTMNMRLSHVDENAVLRSRGRVVIPQAAFRLEEQPATACQDYPEADLNAEISPDFHTPTDPDQPVVGFADVHTHVGFPKAMAAVAMSGGIFHPYGIEHALHNCDGVHGENGTLDLLESQNSGAAKHDTTGYPDFVYWPNRKTNTHVQAYYRWIRRAHLSGLQLMVTLVTGNPTFCQLLSVLHSGKTEGGCNGTDAVAAQTRYIYELQDYIDAQAGGPGKGWFRVVTSPQQARQVIAQRKLAVVLGIEHGSLFDCAESFAGCTPEYVDEKIDEIHKLGIRSVFPLHRFDNAFGGTRPAGGASGAWMHLTSMISTSKIRHLFDLIRPSELLFKDIGGHFWEMESCPAGVDGTKGLKSMEEFVEKDFGFVTDAVADVPTIGPLLEDALNAIFLDKLRPLPDYKEFSPDDSACNRRGLQPIGRHLVHGLIDRGMIVEIDHLSYNTLQATLEVLEEREYSGFISSHGWLEHKPSIIRRIMQLGGLVAPMNSRPSKIADGILEYEGLMEEFSFPVGMAIGTDIQGVTSQTEADPHSRIDYPFTSVDGMVTFTRPQTGNRQYDFVKDGMAHYGLLAEWVESLRQEGEKRDPEVMRSFMNSAEAYLQMWERAAAGAP